MFFAVSDEDYEKAQRLFEQVCSEIKKRDSKNESKKS